MNTSGGNLYREYFANSSSITFASQNTEYFQLSLINKEAIKTIKAYERLEDNWDSYHGAKTSPNAIKKAISFILWLSKYNIDVYYTAPSPDGDVLVEIRDGQACLEFEFTPDNSDNVCATFEGEYMQAAELNETTQQSYLKWLICPHGECPPNL